MSGVSEKARFYLERSVPQLREWEDKEIFSKVRPVHRLSRLPALTYVPGGNPHHRQEAQRLRAQGPVARKQALGVVLVCQMGAVPRGPKKQALQATQDPPPQLGARRAGPCSRNLRAIRQQTSRERRAVARVPRLHSQRQGDEAMAQDHDQRPPHDADRP